jgi:hypothetical protein
MAGKEILDAYPDFEIEDVREALRYAAEAVRASPAAPEDQKALDFSILSLYYALLRLLPLLWLDGMRTLPVVRKMILNQQCEDSSTRLRDILRSNRLSGKGGVYAVCSAHPAPIPFTFVSQYLPLEYEAIRTGELQAVPEPMIEYHIRGVLRVYADACSVKPPA